ncbi:MAG: hypothetical protein K6E50_06580 [Lachnospiraceae bacterium]|nr:hypothetical protein [Lachnospiraceae bacterium]
MSQTEEKETKRGAENDPEKGSGNAPGVRADAKSGEKTGYVRSGDPRDAGFDLRRFLLLFVRRLWMFLPGMVIGALLFGGYRFVKEKIFAPETIYRNDTLYSIEFTIGQEGETQAWYNDATWNDVIDTDVIAGVASRFLTDVNKSTIAKASFVPTLTDIHMFHVYVDDRDPQRADDIQNALGLALQIFASTAPGFESISVWDRGKAKVVEEISTILRWTVAGACIGALVSFLLLAYCYVMDDRILLAADVRRGGGKCLGVMFKGKEDAREEARLREELQKQFKDTEALRIVDPVGTAVPAEAARHVMEMLPEGIRLNTGEKDAEKLICIAAGSVGVAELSRFLEHENGAVVLCEASPSLHRAYYFHSVKRNAKKAGSPEQSSGAEKEENDA